MSSFRLFLVDFHLGAASGWDLFIGLILLIAILIYGLFLGRNRMIVLLLGSYFSFLILRFIPWKNLGALGWLGIGDKPSISLQIIFFLGFILLFYFLIPRSVLSSVLRIKNRGEASWLQLFVLSVAQVGFLAMVILSFAPLMDVADLGGLAQKIFIGPSAQFVWVLLPILTVSLMKRKKKLDE